MKRVCLAIFLTFSAVSSLFADSVSQQKARQIAQSYLDCGKVELAADNFSLAGAKASAADSPAYFIFNSETEGWVIISGEDSTVPVLARGDSGKFIVEDMPEQVRYWLERINSTIKAVRADTGIKQSEQIKALWANPRPVRPQEAATAKYLETACWGQGSSEDSSSPFNMYCPEYAEGHKSITGCVATAMAEVLHYNKYPKKGKGTIPAYTTSSYGIEMPQIDIEGYAYNWDIPSTPYQLSEKDWSKAQKEAVAKLMLHLGCMVSMDYGPESLSSSLLISDVLSEYMGYSSASYRLYRSAGSPMDWLNVLKAEIDSNRPVIYSGKDNSGGGGHAFVIDGYDSDNKVHVNWGWNGKNNGWFAVNYLGKVGSGGWVFSTMDSAAIELVPDNSIDEDANPILSISYSYYSEDIKNGLEVISGSIKSKSFDIGIDLLMNESKNDYNSSIKICLVDKNDVYKCDLSAEVGVRLKPYWPKEIKRISCTIPSDINPVLGDYIALFYVTPSGKWKRAKRYLDVDPLLVLDKLNPFDFSIIKTPSNIREGNVIYPEVLHRNIRLTSEVWTIDDKSVVGGNFVAASGEHTLEVSLGYVDGSSETVRKKITVQ